MKVIVVEPGKPAYLKEIRHTLKSMQEIVGGYIEATYPYDDPVALVCNDEGKINNLPFNRAIEETDDWIAGTFFICGIGRDDFCDIPDELIDKYLSKFTLKKEPFSFKGPQEMLDALQQMDLYSAEHGIYVFLYNEAGAVCTYSVGPELAVKLAELAEEHDEYWGAFLGWGGSIYDNPLDFCEFAYRWPWFDTRNVH